MRDLTILSIDHGEQRIGLAIKPPDQMAALPLGIIDGQPVPDAMMAIRKLIADRQVSDVVVGLPVHDDPSQGKRVKRFTRRLRQGIRGVRWHFVDESLTSEAAADAARAAGVGSSRKAIDDRAAALILDTFMQGQPRTV